MKERFNEILEPRRWKLLARRLGLDILFILIWSLTVLLLVIEFYSDSLKIHRGLIIFLELVIDFLATADITRRALKSRGCNEYMANIWNWLDLFTIWIVLVHWIIFAVEPAFQIVSDGWLAIRYSLLVIRLGYWTVFGRRHYEKYHRVATDDFDPDDMSPNALHDSPDGPDDDIAIEMTAIPTKQEMPDGIGMRTKSSITMKD